MHGSGQQKRNYLHVEDLAEGSMVALKSNLKNKTVTLASNKNIKIIDLAKKIIKLTKSKSKIKFDKKIKRIDDFTSNFTSNNKIYNFLGWKPKFTLSSGLSKYIKNKNFVA